MGNSPFDYLNEIMSAPLGELISSIGAGVAEAQASLDAGSLAQTLSIYDTKNSDELSKKLREIGYQPTFYVLPETEVEAQVSFSLSVTNPNQNAENLNQDSSASLKQNVQRTKMFAAPVNASNSNRYGLNISAMAKLKFKIVPVPPPADYRLTPDLIDKINFEEAEKDLIDLGLNYKIVNLDIDIQKEDKKKLKVIKQIPVQGSILKVNDIIELELIKL